MKLKDMTLTELKALSYTDIAYMVLTENKKTLNTPKLFKKVCELLEYSEEEYTSKIGDFYTSLTTDCRFLILDNAEWDLRDKHVVKMEVDEDDDEEVSTEDIEESEESEDEIEDENDEENIDEIVDDELDDDDDDLDDFSIIEDDEDEEN